MCCLGRLLRSLCGLSIIALGTLQLPAQETSRPADSYPKLRDLDAHCPFSPPESLAQWQARSADLKQQLLVSLGLWPMPQLEPIKPQIYGKMQLDGYTIEKAIFETLPGLYVTGNLYRPDPMPAGKVPGVLCPHGHWNNARFYDESPAARASLLATGAERFENAARNHIQARCVQLARMGCVVYHWDMIGYCDATQISYDRAHRFAKQPQESEVNDDGWLLFSPLAESHAQSIPGLQTLAGIRGVDFLLSLPEVDSTRIAITGASGGGTQSFITAAVDPRIALSFPAVMVSTSMQGGCTCENACWLRTGTNNCEMASLIAPRPLGMTTANDWTKNMPSDGFPEMQKLYELHGAKDKVALFPAAHFPHNYNHVARVSMYGWINKHFKLGLPEPILERDFTWKGQEDLHVWDADHPQPEGGEQFERQLLKRFSQLIDQQYQQLEQAGQDSELRDILIAGWRVCLGLTSGPVEAVTATPNDSGLTIASASDGQWQLQKLNSKNDEATLKITLVNSQGESQAYQIILVGQQLQADGRISELEQQPLVGNPRLAAAYTYGYNQPLVTRRTRQLGATLRWLAETNPGAKVQLDAQGDDVAVAAGGALVAEQLKTSGLSLRLQPASFSFAKVQSIRDPNFLPGAARYRDLAGLISCLSSACEVVQ